MKKFIYGILIFLMAITLAVPALSITVPPTPNPKFTAMDSNGDPATGYKLYTYQPGTTTNQATYSDYDLSTANANPVVLDSNGQADVYFSVAIKFVLKTAADVTVWTVDNIQPVQSYYLSDDDGDTIVNVEESADEDKIRFDVGADGERGLMDLDETLSYFKINSHEDADGDTAVQVEESADEDKIRFDIAGSEAAQFDDSGRLLIGDTATRTLAGQDPSLQVTGTGFPDSMIGVQRFSADNNTPRLTFGKSRGATAGTYTVVQDNDVLGFIGFAGADGTDLATNGAYIFARVNGTPGANDLPTELVLSTTADGSAAPTEWFNFTSDGRFLIGVTNEPTANAFYANCNYSGYAGIFLNDGNNQNRYGLQIHAGADDGSGATYYLNAMDGNADQVGYIINNGGTFQLVDVSDERTKKNIKDTEIKGVDTIKNIDVIDFQRAANDETVTGGFTAQQLLEVFPEAVSGRPGDTEEYEAEPARGDIVNEMEWGEDIVILDNVTKDEYQEKFKHLGKWKKTKEAVKGVRDKMMGVAQSRLIPVLVKAVQEQQKLIDELFMRVDALEAR